MVVAVGGAAACGGDARESPAAEGPDAGDASGGATCASGAATVCQGDSVHTCNPDGSVGALVEECASGCWEGSCGGGGGTDEGCDAAGNDLIYVVDDDYRLLSFDPRKLDTGEDPFALIGDLDCPAGAPWPDWSGGGPATPFSMSVDRDGMAWVLYTSGQIFRVSIADASCGESGFQRGQRGFELFGMGFSSDAEGSGQETLFIAGGGAAQEQVGDLGRVPPDTMSVAMVGGLPDSEFPPELTGTANAELYAYFPGRFDSWVGRLSKDSANQEQSWELDPISGQPRGWAFAHWGGKFYIFISTESAFGGIRSQVKVLDPAGGGEQTAISNSHYMVVGAGVSTCAPVVVD
jgi:hypothetical protein